MSVILRKPKNTDGTTTLRLDIDPDGKRSVETLKHLKLAKPSNLLDRVQPHPAGYHHNLPDDLKILFYQHF
jgi:hypothetical protein